VLNSPGTIDSDYRGEVKIILINLGEAPFRVHRGERIAQLVVAPVTQARLARTKALDATKRGKGGFGSTRVGTETSALPKGKTLVARKKSVKTKA
jgi:dUTP pyrophosphatase